MTKRAIIGADIFDGTLRRSASAFLLDGDRFAGIADANDIPPDYTTTRLEGGTVLPGFVDLQVNGGGGVMFNEDTNVEGLKTIAAAHLNTGTRAFLPTLITDTPDRTRAAIDAVAAAIAANIPGIIGLHLEGPHLSVARKGAHDPDLIRPMEDPDIAILLSAADKLPNLMITVAPENVSHDQIRKLSDSGIIVSLGHSDCSFETAQAAFAAGATSATHLFNAMSQFTARAPGLAGAVLENSAVSAGLIADDIHVHAATMRVALAAKRGPGEIFIVSDAMATAGSDITEFTLNGRTIHRKNGRLTLADGTLAGADLSVCRAISILVRTVGLSPDAAMRMATSAPAKQLRKPQAFGCFVQGQPAQAIHIGDDFSYLGGVS